jgi:hypothetical protein
MADAQYVIDIAAAMPAGDALAADLDAITAKLTAAGVGADGLADAVAIASNALADASAATKRANEALAAGSKAYADLELAASQAAKAEEKAATSGVIPPDVAAAARDTAAALDAYLAPLKQLEKDAAAAEVKERALGVQLRNVRQITVASTADHAAHQRGLKKLAGAFHALGGPLGAVGSLAFDTSSKFGDMSKAIGGAHTVAALAAAGIVALVVAVAALGVALVASVSATAAWAIGLADAKRSAELTSDALVAMHPELKALSGTIAAVAKETGAHSDELQELAGKLKAAKVAAADMPDALRAAALAEAALGSGGAQDFIDDLKTSKRAAGELSREVSSKLAPIVSSKMRGLSAQSQHFKDLIGSLFGGLNIEPVLNGLKRLVDLFDENTAAGQAIQLIFESVFQPLIDGADKAAIMIEAFVLGFLIAATKLYIALKPVIRGIAEFFGFDDPTTADTLAMVTKAGEILTYVVFGLVAAFGALVAIGAVVAAALAAPWVALTTFVAGVVAAGAAIYNAAGDIGRGMMRGLAEGITAFAGLPISAIVGAANAAIWAAKKALGIASPSKVFAELGGYTAEGFAEGVDEGAAQAGAAMAGLLAPPPAATGASRAPAGGARSIDLSGASFTFNGVQNAEHATQLFQEMLTRFFEGTADSIAGPEVVPA